MTMTKIPSRNAWYTYGHGPLINLLHLLTIAAFVLRVGESLPDKHTFQTVPFFSKSLHFKFENNKLCNCNCKKFSKISEGNYLL